MEQVDSAVEISAGRTICPPLEICWLAARQLRAGGGAWLQNQTRILFLWWAEPFWGWKNKQKNKLIPFMAALVCAVALDFSHVSTSPVSVLVEQQQPLKSLLGSTWVPEHATDSEVELKEQKPESLWRRGNRERRQPTHDVDPAPSPTLHQVFSFLFFTSTTSDSVSCAQTESRWRSNRRRPSAAERVARMEPVYHFLPTEPDKRRRL